MKRLFLPLAALVLVANPSFAQSADLAPASVKGTLAMAPGVSVPLGDANSLALLYDNGPLVTGTGNGPSGANTSALQTALGQTSYGAGHSNAGGVYVADDFTVPAGGWTITDFDFFSYQTGGNATTTTITGVFVQIWNGPPGVAGSTVIYGDRTTNRLASSTFSNIYRILDTDPPATTSNRPIWRNKATVNTTLPAGTYWVEWSTNGTLASGPWAPPVTTAGAIPPGNARQEITGAYGPLLDGTTPLDLPFIVNGTAGSVAGPVLTITPTTVSFGTVANGTTATRTVTITNNGTTAANISAIALTGSPAITATGNTAGALAPGASRTVTLTFAPTTANTGAVTATLTITSDAPGSPATVTITGTGDAATGYPSTDTPITIPDNVPAGITSTITIPASVAGTIIDLNVDLNITHTWAGDLIVGLAKGAVTSSLADRPGVAPGGTGFGCNGDNMVIIADDQGTAGSTESSCVAGGPAYTTGGRYTPNTPLTVFNATPAAGTYTLTVSDNGAGDLGTLNSWALLVTTGGVAGEGTASTLSSRLSVAPNPMRGASQIDLTVGTAQDVRVSLYDALGREVAVLLDRSMTAGQQAYVGVDTSSLPSGVYVVRATGTDLNLTQRVTVVR